MKDFLLYSIVGSVVLTIIVNILPIIFPKTSQKAQAQIHKKMSEKIDQVERGEAPRVQFFFSWKWMLIGSIVLTVLVNTVGYFAR